MFFSVSILILLMVPSALSFDVNLLNTSDPGTDSFRATGSLTSLQGTDNVNVSFEYRKKGDSSFKSTSNKTVSSIGTFTQTITVQPNETYEVRAVAENKSNKEIGKKQTPFDLTKMSYTGNNINTRDGAPTGITFNNDGTKLYEIGFVEGKIYSYVLSTPYDITTATYTRNINTQDNFPEGITFNNDGTKLYEVAGGGKIYSHTLTTPYDLSTATFTGNSMDTRDGAPTEITFNNDGTKLYETGTFKTEIYSHDLSTPYDITTATFTGNSINTQDGSPAGITFNNDGTKLYETGEGGPKIYTYTLTTPYDLSTATFTGNSIKTQDNLPEGITFNNDGTKLYEVGNVEDTIYSYSADSFLSERNTTLLKTIPGKAVGFSTPCSLNSENQLKNNAVLNLRGCDTFTVGSNGLYSSPSGLTLRADILDIESGGRITAGDLDVFTRGLDLADIESINAVGKGSNGGNGTVFLCDTLASVSCSGKDDSGVNLNVSLNKTSDGLYRIRNITEDWSTGFLNWTENVSLTSEYDSDWNGAIEANYTIYNLTANVDFKVLKDGSVVETENSGANGRINFSTRLTDKHRFEVLESVEPTFSNLQQEADIVNPNQNTSLSLNILDVGSGVSTVKLETNESGILQNRSIYRKNLDNVNDGSVSFNWSSSSFEGQNSKVRYRFYVVDGAGNVNSTSFKSFKVDGKRPQLSNLVYPEVIDVDESPASISLDASDPLAGLDSAVIEQNSSGSFTNRSVALGGNPVFSTSTSNEIPQDVEFQVFVNDTVGNTASETRAIEFKNVSISLSAEDSVLSGERIDVSGSSNILPDNKPVDGSLNAFVNAGGGFEDKGTISVNSLGDFEYAVNSAKVAGTHDLKLNYTNSKGVSGQVLERFNTTLNISSPDAVFKYSGTKYADVDRDERDLNLTAFVSNSTDSKVCNVTAEVNLPNGSVRNFSLSNTTQATSSGTWFREINSSEEFNNVRGRYNVSFTAETERGIGSNIANKSFYVRNVTIQNPIGDKNVTTGENFTLSGSVTLQPSENNLGGKLRVEKPSETVKLNVSENSFNSNISVSEPGTQTLNISYNTTNNIVGGSTVVSNIFSINPEITSTKAARIDTNTVFKDSTSDVDLNITDQVTADINNPSNINSLDLNYEFPSGFNIRENNPFIGTLGPGESSSNNPEIDIGTSIEPGNYTIKLSTSSQENLESKDEKLIRVFTKSQSNYLNVQDGAEFSRAKSETTIKANVTDTVGGKPLEDINTSLILRDSNDNREQTVRNTSEATGIVSFKVNLSSLEEGSGKRMTLRTLDQPSLNVNSSETITSNDIIFDLQAQMRLEGQNSIPPVQRNGETNSFSSGSVVDSSGSSVSGASVTAKFPNQTITKSTDSDGAYIFQYNPNNRVQPGIKTVNFTAEKESFKDLEFSNTVEVRGNLSIEGRVNKNFLQKGKSENLKSVVTNSLDQGAQGSVSWSLNSTSLGPGQNISTVIPTGFERGVYNLNASTNRQHYNDDRYSKNIRVNGLASVDLNPDDFSINPDNDVTFKATVTNQTGGSIENYPVSFFVNGSKSAEVVTNGSGVATFNQGFNTGITNITAKIKDSKNLFYNTSDASDETIIRPEKRLKLRTYKLSKNDVFRYFERPFRTEIDVELLETTDTPELAPASGETVSVTVNGSESVSCTTNSDGLCVPPPNTNINENVMVYNPGSNVSVGNLTARAETSKQGWKNVNKTTSLVVRGDLNLDVSIPSNNSNIGRGSDVSLEASVTSSETGSVNVPINWTIDGQKVGSGESDIYTVPTGAETGSRNLKATADAPFYRGASINRDVFVLGSAKPVLTDPGNSTKKGYDNIFQTVCEVRSNGVRIENYPVEFVTNSSGSLRSFSSSKTSESGTPRASSAWNPVNRNTRVSVGCRITDNRSLGFTAVETADTKIFNLVDNKPPEISNLTISPTEVDPGSNTTISFNATEESEIGNINLDVIDPQLDVTDIPTTKISETGYKAAFAAPESEGAYSAVLTVTDTADNSARDRKGFEVNPGGEIATQTSEKVIKDMRSDESSSFNVEINAFVNETADSLNISAEASNGEDQLSFNTTEYNCGDVSQGSYCNKTFEINVPANTAPTGNSPIFAEFRANWISPDDKESSTLTFTEVKLEPNPILETRSSASGQTTHNSKQNITVQFKSRGNTPVNSIRPEFKTSGPLEAEFFGTPNSLEAGEQETTKMQVEVPTGTSPDTYTGVFELNSDNAPKETTEIDIEVPQDPGYRAESSVSTSAVSQSSGKLTELKLNSTGNLNTSFNPSFVNGPNNAGCGRILSADDFTLQKQSIKNITINYDFSGFDFQGTCKPILELSTQGEISNDKDVDLEVDVVSFSANTSVKKIAARPGDTSSFNISASLGGQPETNLSISARLGSERIKNLNKTQKGNNFTVDYEIPKVNDASTHDLNVNVTSKEAGVTARKNTQDAVTVPDLTPPAIEEFKLEDITPSENLDLNIQASDNSAEGVQNLSARFNGNTSKTVYLEKENKNWTASVEGLKPGIYTAIFEAEDTSGLTTNITKKFRISEPVTFEDTFTTPAGDTRSTQITLTDTVTGKTTQATSSDNGSYNVNVKKGDYNLQTNVDSSKVVLQNASIEENSSFKAAELESSQTGNLAPDSADAIVMGVAVDTNINSSSGRLTLDYSDKNLPPGTQPTDLEVAYCSSIDYDSLNCNSNIQSLELSVLNINRVLQTITIDAPSFSSYTLYAPSEQDSSQTENNQQEQQPADSGGGSSGGGGGGGGSAGLTEEELQQNLQDLKDSISEGESDPVSFGSQSIKASIRPGESQISTLSITNNLEMTQRFDLISGEVISEYVNTPNTVEIPAGESRDIEIKINTSVSELPNSYSGFINVESSQVSAKIPTNIQILPPNEELLDLSARPVFESVRPGDEMKIEINLNNQGYARNVDVAVKTELVDPETNETLATKSNTYAVGTTLTRVVNLAVPEEADRKQYEIKATARYTNLDVPRVANAITTAEVVTPFWERSTYEITYVNIGIGALAVLISTLLGYSGYAYYRKRELEKKRYLENIDLDTIPSGGSRQGYLGKLAEMGKRTFIGLEDLKTHALIAGATGSGKSVTGQVMVEEALEQGTNVIVLDPTAQWTGFLRENKDTPMLQLMQDYGLSKNDAKAYNGNIRAVEPDEEEIDITPYLEEDQSGNIIVFSLHKLDSKNIDDFVDNTVQQVFDANLPERDDLETLIVYDEVHRLLEKFGGTGEGLKQIERGAREFRKYGVGMMLLSQVISDFSGEIRANIGTTVQMRTQYDDDLKRMKNKFGIDTVKSIAKAEQGSGMLQNSDYNHGRPYFVNFRPLKHSPHRLSDKELEDYEEYNRKIDEKEKKVDELEQQGEEVYELRNKIKLARRNLRKGGFSLIEIYLDELENDIPQ